jgi:hypothetical protein
MKRFALLVLALAALAPATAQAAAPCRDRIYNDWYGDGKIATTYPIGCYRDALKHVHGDLLVYSSLTDDIRSAMQGALARQHGHSVPAQVGKGGKAGVSPAVVKLHPTTTTTTADPNPGDQVSQMQTVASAPVSSSGGGIPTPIIVLGALALLLAAAGAVGAGLKHRRR